MDSSLMSTELLSVMQASQEDPNAEIIPIFVLNQNTDLMNNNIAIRQYMGDLFRATYNDHNGQHYLQAPNVESPLIGEFVMNQNNDFMNNNTEMDDLSMISAVYNEQNGQRNQQAVLENPIANNPTIESPLMSNEVLSQMQASLEDPDADISRFDEFITQEDDLMDINDATEQELEDLISDNDNGQARYGEIGSSQEGNIVYPTIIVNTQDVAAIMQNAGIQIGDEEYLVELHEGVSSFSPINQVYSEDQFQFSQMVNGGIIF